jgi:hypothetical protein
VAPGDGRPYLRDIRKGPPGVLWTMGCILLVLWAMGYVAGGTVGQWVHLLLGFSLLCFALAVLRGRRHLHRGRPPAL